MKTKSINYLNSLIQDDTPKNILDIIEYIKKCIKNYKEIEKVKNVVDLSQFFEKLWKLYPRKVNKELAKRTFEHKMRGLNENEVRDKANKIYISQQRYIQSISDEKYLAHYSSFLNANVPNSPHYKGV